MSKHGKNKSGEVNEYKKKYVTEASRKNREAYLAAREIYWDGFGWFSTQRFLRASPEQAAKMVNKLLQQ